MAVHCYNNREWKAENFLPFLHIKQCKEFINVAWDQITFAELIPLELLIDELQLSPVGEVR